MEIEQQDVEAFIVLYQTAYGVTFSAEEAERELSKLLQLYKLVYLTPTEFPERMKPNSPTPFANNELPHCYAIPFIADLSFTIC
jgi:hypothetical protein